MFSEALFLLYFQDMSQREKQSSSKIFSGENFSSVFYNILVPAPNNLHILLFLESSFLSLPQVFHERPKI